MEVRKQIEIDFPRAEKLAILAAAILKPAVIEEPGGARKKVSPQVQKAVLKWIDDFARNGREAYPSLDTLARTANMSRRHLCRAIQALEQTGVLIRERGDGTDGRRRDLNYYRIVWTQLAVFAGRHRDPNALPNQQSPSSTSGAPAPSLPHRSPDPRRVAAEPDRDDGLTGSAPGAPGSAPGAPGSAPGAPGSAPGALKAYGNVRRNNPPPPFSLALRQNPQATWEEVVVELLRSGVAEAISIARDARDRRIGPQSILELVEVYRANPGRWRGAGALFHRVRNFRAGQSPGDLALWAPASRGYVSPARAARRGENSAAAADRQRAANRAEQDRLERKHGAALDALAAAEIAELAATVPGLTKFFSAELRSRPISGAARDALLGALDRSQAPLRANEEPA